MLLVVLILGLVAQGADAAGAWKVCAPKSNDFHVVMPLNPTEGVVAGSVAAGQLTRSLSATDADRSNYSVSWTDYAQSPLLGRSAQSLFDAVRKTLESTTDRRVISRASVFVAGAVGEETVLQAADRQLTLVRVTVIGNTFYQLTATARTEADLPKARRFAESFSLNPR